MPLIPGFDETWREDTTKAQASVFLLPLSEKGEVKYKYTHLVSQYLLLLYNTAVDTSRDHLVGLDLFFHPSRCTAASFSHHLRGCKCTYGMCGVFTVVSSWVYRIRHRVVRGRCSWFEKEHLRPQQSHHLPSLKSGDDNRVCTPPPPRRNQFLILCSEAVAVPSSRTQQVFTQWICVSNPYIYHLSCMPRRSHTFSGVRMVKTSVVTGAFYS